MAAASIVLASILMCGLCVAPVIQTREISNLLGRPPIVCPLHAGCIQGTLMPGFQIDHFEAFLGIPYALPPVGELRFRNPVPYPRKAGIYNATSAKADCIQKNDLFPNTIIEGSEDCLYLNVYRPARLLALKKLPVMVFIHGGGFFSGSGDPSLYGPEYFMDSRKVILVTLNYRLGSLGFLSTNDTNMSGNWGLKDQRLALRWVRNNIANFGGNPKHVTLLGHSVGAVSIHMHVLSKTSQGLFRNVIVMSGSANTPYSITQNPLQQTRKLAEFCNITDALHLSTADLASALRNIDAETLVSCGQGLKYWYVEPLVTFRPVVEPRDSYDAFLTQHPMELLESANYKSVPSLVSIVPVDGAVFGLVITDTETLKAEFNEDFDDLLEKLIEWPGSFSRDRINQNMAKIIEEYFEGQHELNDITEPGFLDMLTDRMFHYPYYQTVRCYVNRSDADDFPPMYLYRFNYTGPYTFASAYTGHKDKKYGVVHGDDVLYVFRMPSIFPDFAKNSTDAQVVKTSVDNFVYFAIHNKPAYRQWQPCTKTSFSGGEYKSCPYGELINTDVEPNFEMRTYEKFDVKRMHLWDELLSV